jgi:hypothetical protein
MKLNDMCHLNAKLVTAMQKSNLENKLLRQQINGSVKVKCNHNTDSRVKTVSTQYDNDSVDNASKEETSITTEAPVEEKDVCGTVKTVMNIVCDSIPSYINSSEIDNLCDVKPSIQKVAATINDAVDYIQDDVDPTAVTVIHTGTRNLRKDSTMTVIRRLQRLETNIKQKGLRKIALSGVVHRKDMKLHEKTMSINRAMKDICLKNKWCFIDNDNVDESCLWKDGLHLNDIGKKRLANNIALSVKNFTKFKGLMDA